VKLAQFISHLFDNGNVTVASELKKFESKDLEVTAQLLKFQYDKLVLEMPFSAPPFHEAAALWGSSFIYRTVQFILVRDLDEEEMKTYLLDFPVEKINAAAIYSADLTFRYLKDLLSLAKGLSPSDPLVIRLNEVAGQWAFSSVGIKSLENVNDEMILQNDSLRTAYVDRIIESKDLERIHNDKLEELVAIALGDYANTLWKEFADKLNKYNEGINEG